MSERVFGICEMERHRECAGVNRITRDKCSCPCHSHTDSELVAENARLRAIIVEAVEALEEIHKMGDFNSRATAVDALERIKELGK